MKTNKVTHSCTSDPNESERTCAIDQVLVGQKRPEMEKRCHCICEHRVILTKRELSKHPYMCHQCLVNIRNSVTSAAREPQRTRTTNQDRVDQKQSKSQEKCHCVYRHCRHCRHYRHRKPLTETERNEYPFDLCHDCRLDCPQVKSETTPTRPEMP